MKFKTVLGYDGNLPVTEGFVREVMDTLTHAELKAYLVILMLCVNKKEADADELAGRLCVSAGEVADIIASLEKKKLVKFGSNTVTLLCEGGGAPAYDALFDPEDIKEIPRELTEELQRHFGKLLSNADLNVIVNTYKNYRLPDEVLMIILQYCGSRGIRRVKYFEKIAADWYEKGIDSAQAAHEYIALTERRAAMYERVKQRLGIYGRELTTSQKRFVDAWEGKFSLDEIKEAYESALDHAASKPFVYANKILSGQGSEPMPEKKPTGVQVKKSKFNNFEQKKTDYDAVKKRNLERLLKKWEG